MNALFEFITNKLNNNTFSDADKVEDQMDDRPLKNQ